MASKGLFVLARAAPTLKCGQRGIAGKAMRLDWEPRPKPFDYNKYHFNLLWSLFDKCTARFNENTKLVVVDGAHGVGKSKFAKDLAEELDMHYIPETTMDYYYKSPYGHFDLRELNEYFTDRTRPYDEQDFLKTGGDTEVVGQADRMHLELFQAKFGTYILALRHIFNTGQGVVIEKSPYSHYAYVDAATNAGFLKRESRTYLNTVMFKNSLPWLLRPNLVIYLDAPAELVKKKLAEKHKDSPVLNHPTYLAELYDMMKRDYLMSIKDHSEVLVYDWSDGGDAEIVVEDIERINFDYFGQYEAKQKDWRLYNEGYALIYRLRYTRYFEWAQMMFSCHYRDMPMDAPWMIYTAEEAEFLGQIQRYFPGHRYLYGYNSDMGDKGIWWKMSRKREMMADLKYPFCERANNYPWHFTDQFKKLIPANIGQMKK